MMATPLHHVPSPSPFSTSASFHNLATPAAMRHADPAFNRGMQPAYSHPAVVYTPQGPMMVASPVPYGNYPQGYPQGYPQAYPAGYMGFGAPPPHPMSPQYMPPHVPQPTYLQQMAHRPPVAQFGQGPAPMQAAVPAPLSPAKAAPRVAQPKAVTYDE